MVDLWLAPPASVPVAIAILTPKFVGVTIRTEMPDTRPTKFIIITRIGGDQPNPAQDDSRLLLEFWAKSSATAESMCNTGRAALRNSAAGTFNDTFVYGWSGEQGPTYLNDPTIQDRRRVQIFGDLSISTDPPL